MIENGIQKIAVSIVMPCLNEAGTVADCVSRARQVLAVLRQRHGLEGEIVIADNGSTDGSRELAAAQGARIVAVTERGYGAAVIGGFRAARGRFLVMGDSDLSYDFMEALPMVEAVMAGADLCMGSRFGGEIKPGAMPWKNRYIGNPVLSGILRLLFGSSIADAHCGLRALSKSCFDRLRLTSTGMEFASEMIIKANLLEMRIAQVPVTLAPDKRGRAPHLRPWRDGWRHLRYMLMLSPMWLFFVPAGLLAGLGLTISAGLLWQSNTTMAKFGPFLLGDHWMIAAGTMIAVAWQTALFGFAALLYSFQQGYRRPSALARRLLAASRLEYWLMSGTILAIIGLAGMVVIVTQWASAGFGTLSAVRPLVAASTAFLIGFQTFYGGFLISILSGNEARLTNVGRSMDVKKQEAARPD